MLYILCEDSAMGFEFWRKINSICLAGKAKMNTSNGVSKMILALDNLRINKNDTLLCIFDNIGSKDVYKILNKLKQDSKENRYKYIVSNYYCIEEVFISFKYLTNWLNIANKEVIELFNTINRCIYTCEDYYTNEKLQNLYTNANNREQMSSYFISDISGKYRKGFIINKSKLGVCWVCSCKEGKQIPNYCIANKCFLYNNKILFESNEKLEYIWVNSILNKSRFSIQDLKNLC